MDTNHFKNKNIGKHTSSLKRTKHTSLIKSNPIDRYNEADTKGNLKNSMFKTIIEVLGGGIVAPVLSASLGKFSPLAGIILAFGGNYMGDKTGLIRGVAMGTIAHGIAKSKEYQEENTTIKNRIQGLKDDWLTTLMVKNTTTSINSNTNNTKSYLKTKEFNSPPNNENLTSELTNSEKSLKSNEKIKPIQKTSAWEDDIDFSQF
jgi:hypothetical protein